MTYPVTISLSAVPAGIQVGMSANISVVIASAQGVLMVPNSAVSTIGSVSTVQVKSGDKTSTVSVTIGIKGDADTQIISGLTAGQQVVLPTVSTTGSSSLFPAGGIPGGAGGLARSLSGGGGFGGGGGVGGGGRGQGS